MQNIVMVNFTCITYRYLSPVSMLANLLQFVGLGIIFYYLLQDLPFTWERKIFATWGQLPLYFGTAIYAFEGIGVVLPLENQMKTPATNILRDQMVSRMANTVMMKRAMIENKEGRVGKRNRGRRN